ncbi:MAG: YbaN family protein [Anaerolineae bacterium]
MALGTVFLIIAAVGLVLPLLPTTPFLLLTAGCYARGSGRFYQWLLNNRLFGRYLRDYYEGRGVPLRTKALSLLFLWGVILWSAWRIQHAHAALALIAIALAVSAHILTRPGRQA